MILYNKTKHVFDVNIVVEERQSCSASCGNGCFLSVDVKLLLYHAVLSRFLRCLTKCHRLIQKNKCNHSVTISLKLFFNAKLCLVFLFT